MLQEQIKSCTHCQEYLPFAPNPIFSFSATSKIVLVSQAPGVKAHNSSVPYKDPSGVKLKTWLGVKDEVFYNPAHFAILPMGFCYPGKGKSGDLPPRKECAPLWHEQVWTVLQDVQLILLIGQYAQAKYLGKTRKNNLTQTVAAYQSYLPKYFPLVHPSPRNRMWHRKNPWFEQKVIPHLQVLVKEILPI